MKTAGYRFGRCPDCRRRFRIWFDGQERCSSCAGDRKRRARARMQPDLPLGCTAEGRA